MLDWAYHILEWPKIERNQWRRPDEIRYMQEKALTKLAAHAYKNVPYYKTLFDRAGFGPPRRMTLEDLRTIPTLTKDSIIANYPDNIMAKDFDEGKYSTRMTSGSSGKKLEVALDNRVAALYRLMQFRQLVGIGYKPWQMIAYVRFSPPVTSIALQKINLFRRCYIPLEWDPERQVSEIMGLKPQAINAYPSVLFLLAKTIKEDDARGLGLKFLLSNSELLTPHVRRYCEEKFGCEVYDDYSCLEFSAIASECRMHHLHVASDNVIVEVLDDNGRRVESSVPGKIVVTALNNYSMPYIRYEIGDVGALMDAACPCGRGFPVLKNIIGRCDDFLVMPSGDLIDPQTIVFQIETIPDVKEFRVVQETNRDLVISIVPSRGAEFIQIRNEISMKLKKFFDGRINVTIFPTNALDRGATGKHRSIISRASGRSDEPLLS